MTGALAPFNYLAQNTDGKKSFENEPASSTKKGQR
jgi:hypothetical protein